MIDRYHLRYFLAVVDAGNFSRAAQQVNVTQPTLSTGIAKLEVSLGAKLFIRNSRRVELTDAGVNLLRHARAIEIEFNALETRLTQTHHQRVFRLGVLTTLPSQLIAGAVAESRRMGAEQLELIEGSERDLVGRLQRRRIDVALTVVRTGEARFPSDHLFDEGYSLAVREDHPLSAAEAVSGDGLGDQPMIVRRHCEALPETSRYFTERGVRPHFSYRSTNDDRVVAMVKAGLGITVMPDSYAQPGLSMIRLAGFNARRRIGLLFADSTQSTHPSAIVQVLRLLRQSPLS